MLMGSLRGCCPLSSTRDGRSCLNPPSRSCTPSSRHQRNVTFTDPQTLSRGSGGPGRNHITQKPGKSSDSGRRVEDVCRNNGRSFRKLQEAQKDLGLVTKTTIMLIRLRCSRWFPAEEPGPHRDHLTSSVSILDQLEEHWTPPLCWND